MKVLLGHTRSSTILDILQKEGWGRMWAEKRPFHPYPGEQWGLDNGAFAAWQNDEPWEEKQFIDRALQAQDMEGCIMAVLPDKVAEGEASLDFSLDWLNGWDKHEASLPWYLAVQDGMDQQPVWGRVCEALKDDRITGLFLGGTNRFKATAGQWITTATACGVKFHYGRAGTPPKVQHAMRINADSLDSAFPLWTMERMEKFRLALKNELPQMNFEGFLEEWHSDGYNLGTTRSQLLRKEA